MTRNNLAVTIEAGPTDRSLVQTFVAHWPEYLMEAIELGLFMVSACAFTVLLFHPASPVAQTITSELGRRALMGVAMGATAIGLILSPLGQRSGGHFNPAVTLAFLRLGKIQPWDAFFYVTFQFIGGAAGVLIASLALHQWIAHQSVNYVATLPGPNGTAGAFAAELVISFLLMTVVLTVSQTKRLARWTGLFAGTLVAVYITVEAPLSGTSMNPARTLASALGAQVWTSLWIYFTAPPLGMLLAAQVYQLVQRGRAIGCAKLHHYNQQRCIFRCDFQP